MHSLSPFAKIIGMPMISTNDQAFSKGREISKMINIWMVSAKAPIKKADRQFYMFILPVKHSGNDTGNNCC